MKLQAFSILSACILGLSSAQAAVWQETQKWDSNWEQKYSDWIQNSFNEEIFVSGPYKGIPTDCADAVYTARLIFSYENKLPFVIRDSTGGSNRISHKMSRFDSISDPLQRVRKFIEYVNDVTSTKTLPEDTYPVTINRTHVRAGTIWARPRVTRDHIVERIIHGGVKDDPGHAEIVKEVSDTGAIDLIGSTVPKAVRQLSTTSSLVFMPVESSTGLRNWMLPEYYDRSRSSLPGYSLEQFKELGKGRMGHRRLSRWADEVQSRLALRTESRGESIARHVQNVCRLVNSRVDVIARSEDQRRKLGGRCMDESDFDSYSTPSRDKRIKATLKQVTEAAEARGLTTAQKAKKLKGYFDQCPDIQIAPGRKISLYDFALKLLKNDVSSDPNDSFEARWGLDGPKTHCR